MNTNIVISLDTRRAKKDGTFPVVMRLGHHERTTSIQTSVSVLAKDWDEKNRCVRKSYSGTSSVSRLNNLIAKKKADAMDIIFGLHEQGLLSGMSIKDLRQRISVHRNSQSFFAFADDLIAELKTANRHNTANINRDVVSVLRGFVGGKDLVFQDISFSFLSKFEAFHIGKGNSYNGLAVYMRTIRAIYNKAIKSGLVDRKFYPFEDYKIKVVPTRKRALDWDVFKLIIALELPPDHKFFHARNYFIASYMMYGMNYTDMAYLKWSDIKAGRINYRRNKTSKLYDIKVTEGLQGILDFYKDMVGGFSNHVFPILKRSSIAQQVDDIKWSRKRYNSKLKGIAEMCSIEEDLTSYVSRHSFATQAQTLNIPIKAISTMLGHSDLKTTEIYLKSLPTNVLDDFNEQILKG